MNKKEALSLRNKPVQLRLRKDDSKEDNNADNRPKERTESDPLLLFETDNYAEYHMIELEDGDSLPLEIPEDMKNQILEKKEQQKQELLAFFQEAGNVSEANQDKKPQTFPRNAEELRRHWDQIKQKEKYTERLTPLILVLLHYIETYPKRRVHQVFLTLLQRTSNKDVPYYIEHLKDGKTTFKISQIQNPDYFPYSKSSMNNFNLLRFVKARKDLLELIITTFDLLCIHRSLTNGVKIGPFSHENSQEMLTEDDGDGWFAEYRKQRSWDFSITENEVTPEGSTKLFQQYWATKVNEDVLHSPTLDLINNNQLLTTDNLYGFKSANENGCLYLPLFRSMYVTYKPFEEPIFRQFALREKGCRFIKNSVHNLFNFRYNETSTATDLARLRDFLPEDKALFVTNLLVTVDFDDTQDAAPQENMKEETLFEIIDRKTEHYSYLKTSKPQDILRNTGKPYSNETSLSLGNILQHDFPKAVLLIDDYFANDHYMNVEANLALYKVQPTDHITAKLSWKAIEGHKDFVTPYLLASTLYGTTKFIYTQEHKKVQSKAAQLEDPVLANILEKHFPLIDF